MIKRIGTGEVPDTVGVESVAVLLQPATFNTVTLILPLVVSKLVDRKRPRRIIVNRHRDDAVAGRD